MSFVKNGKELFVLYKINIEHNDISFKLEGLATMIFTIKGA